MKIVNRNEYGEEEEIKKLTMAEKLFHICGEAEFVILVRKILELRMRSMEMIQKASEMFQKKTVEGVVQEAMEKKEAIEVETMEKVGK